MNISISVYLVCEECKNELTADDRGYGHIRVIPCKTCIEKAKNDTEGKQ